MKEKVKESVAASMETETKLLPFLPYLVQDLWVLGSSVDLILSGIESLHLSDGTTVIDLCCGKGGISVQIAKNFGYKVTGIDVMSDFLNEAQKKSNEFKVSHLCHFIEQDVNEYVKDAHLFDLVILGAAGSIFGSLKNTVGVLRSQIKKGGYIFIDDGYLRNTDHFNRRGYEFYLNYQESKNALLSYNDRIVAEINTNEISHSINYEYHTLIEKRGAELITKYPEMEEDIRNYIEEQADECDVLDTEIEGMLWILQKVMNRLQFSMSR